MKFLPLILKCLILFSFSHFLVSFHVDIHALRPHPGQIEVARRFCSLLDSDHHPSEIAGQSTKPYSKTEKEIVKAYWGHILLVCNSYVSGHKSY